MSKRKQQPSAEHMLLGIKVTAYNVRVGSGINHEIKIDRMRSDDSQVYRFDTHIVVDGVATYPDDKIGDLYEIDIYGHELYPGSFASKLSDYHVRDESGSKKYRKLRGREVPIYDAPNSIGHLERRYKTKIFTGAVWVAPNIVTDMLILLSHVHPILMEAHLTKVDRNWGISSLALQTTDPAEN